MSKRSPSVAGIETHSSTAQESDRGRVIRVVIMGGAVLLILFAWLQLIMALQISTTSREIQELGKELERIERENMAIAHEIAEAEMLGTLSARAARLGYGPRTPVYLSLSEPVAEGISSTLSVAASGVSEPRLEPSADLAPLSRFLINARFDGLPAAPAP